MKKLNILLAICIVLFGLGFVYIPSNAFVLMRIMGAMFVSALLLVPAGAFWYNWLNHKQ